MDQRERDRALVGRVIGGDRDAYGELCRLYYEPLRRYVGSRLVYADMIDDAVQTAFLRVHKILPEHDVETPFWPFLQQVAKLVVYEELRSAKRFPQRETDEVLEVMINRRAESMEQGPDDVQDQRLAALERCLRKLSEWGQQVLRRFYQECRPLNELAAEIGKRANTLAAQVHRWRAQLSDCMAHRLSEEDR